MNQAQLLNYIEKANPAALRVVQAGGYATALPQLSAAEKALLYHYTEDGYEALNAGLHDTPFAPLPAVGQALAAILAKLPPHVGQAFSGVWLRPSELQFYRACVLAGTAVRWPAFLSASTEVSIAMQFLRTASKNCLFVIRSRSGCLIEAVSKYGLHGQAPGQNEHEILFRPQTEFDVLAVSEQPGFTRITLQEL